MILAGPVRRLIAYIIDLAVLNVIFLVLTVLFQAINFSAIEYWKLFYLIFIVYFMIMDSGFCKGQSVGKKKLCIKLISENAEYLTMSQTFMRSFYTGFVYFSFSLMPFVYEILNNNVSELINVLLIAFIFTLAFLSITLMMVFHPCYQGVQDHMVKSLVVKEKENLTEKELTEFRDSRFNLSRIFTGYLMSLIALIFVGGMVLFYYFVIFS